MDDNSTSDDETKREQSGDEQKDSTSPQMGGKKLKMNDGSSQDSFQDIGAESKEKDENVDSGVSADKSESTSSDDRVVSTVTAQEGPSNEIINAAPSSSNNFRAILFNIKNKKGNRNYRKRKTPDRDTESNDSSQDSDDLSAEENAEPLPIRETSRETTTDRESNSDENPDQQENVFHRFLSSLSDDDSDTTSNYSHSSEGSNMGDRVNSDDTDSDDGRWMTLDDDEEEAQESTEEPDRSKQPSVLKKERPKHNWFALREIIKREMGLTFPFGKVAKDDVIFERNYYGSLHAVYRMKRLHKLNKHKGCVNSINFHPEGHLLASGSDDTNVVIWDWARNNALQVIKTGHKSNVFQSKFLYLNAMSQLNIVTCARDGQVRLLQCPASGGAASKRKLMAHARAAHKLHVSAAEPHLVLSAGEDGLVMQADVRADAASRLFIVKGKGSTIPLYSVHGHPLDSMQLVVAGRDMFVRVYDRRKSVKPLAMYCPTYFYDNLNSGPVQNKPKRHIRMSMMHLTCAVYNHNGTEILGSYNDEDIYLFDTAADKVEKNIHKEGYTHRYSGHRNSATFKGVSFFGPNSQYIVSGSDCSYIYMWDRNTESIVQWMQGDNGGVVNCIESHPRCPVMATSGLDKDVKIWGPILQKDPDYKGLEKIVKENNVPPFRSPLFNDFLPTLYSAWRSENRVFSDDEPGAGGGERVEFDVNVCTTF